MPTSTVVPLFRELINFFFGVISFTPISSTCARTFEDEPFFLPASSPVISQGVLVIYGGHIVTVGFWPMKFRLLYAIILHVSSTHLDKIV